MALFGWGQTPWDAYSRDIDPNEKTNDGDVMKNNETHRKQNDANVNKKKERQWIIVIQNMEGLVSEKSKEKVELLKEYTEVDNIILMNPPKSSEFNHIIISCKGSSNP